MGPILFKKGGLNLTLLQRFMGITYVYIPHWNIGHSIMWDLSLVPCEARNSGGKNEN